MNLNPLMLKNKTIKEFEESDLDILVEFNRPIGLDFVDLADELENILNLKVDLVFKKRS